LKKHFEGLLFSFTPGRETTGEKVVFINTLVGSP
jgi:hypothetical protein